MPDSDSIAVDADWAPTEESSAEPAPRRVLVVAPQPFFQERGTPIALRHVVVSLSELGFHVDVLTFPLGESLEIPNVRYFRVPNYLGFSRIPIGFSLRKVWLDLFLWRHLRKLIRTEKYTCIHAVEEAAFIAVLVAGPWEVPVVYDMQSSLVEQLHGHWAFAVRPVRRLLELCERWLLRKADRVACSAGLEQRVRRLVPEAHVLRWTFPGTYEEGAMAYRSELRAELGIRRDQMVVVYTGNFAEYQGLRLLADSIPAVRAVHSDVVFVLVGAVGEEAASIARHLQARVPAEGYRLIKRQPAVRMARYLAAADIAVSPRSHGSNLPLKIIEYLAAGLPIVATDIPAHTAMLDDNIALLVKPTADGIAQGTIRLIEDTVSRVRLEAAARAYAGRHLGPAAFLLSVALLYDDLEGVGLPF